MSVSAAASRSLRMVPSRRSACVRRGGGGRRRAERRPRSGGAGKARLAGAGARARGKELTEAGRAAERGVEGSVLEGDAAVDEDELDRTVAAVDHPDQVAEA